MLVIVVDYRKLTFHDHCRVAGMTCVTRVWGINHFIVPVCLCDVGRKSKASEEKFHQLFPSNCIMGICCSGGLRGASRLRPPLGQWTDAVTNGHVS